jgi:hypothetical protein
MLRIARRTLFVTAGGCWHVLKTGMLVLMPCNLVLMIIKAGLGRMGLSGMDLSKVAATGEMMTLRRRMALRGIMALRRIALGRMVALGGVMTLDGLMTLGGVLAIIHSWPILERVVRNTMVVAHPFQVGSLPMTHIVSFLGGKEVMPIIGIAKTCELPLGEKHWLELRMGMGRVPVIVALLRIGLRVKVPLRMVAIGPGIGIGSFQRVAGHAEMGREVIRWEGLSGSEVR